eukprot:TRINITY_DN41248_c0_g1_i1.p1 TRINITY_DN41248_c0_g1~~TRINITY_DN41248_c0_g1_i1.p1  ORF type:complete len:1182 (-),score=240.96 TRINITY_DN41248_c0_g1_i1:114-3593(-)
MHADSAFDTDEKREDVRKGERLSKPRKEESKTEPKEDEDRKSNGATRRRADGRRRASQGRPPGDKQSENDQQGNEQTESEDEETEDEAEEERQRQDLSERVASGRSGQKMHDARNEGSIETRETTGPLDSTCATDEEADDGGDGEELSPPRKSGVRKRPHDTESRHSKGATSRRADAPGRPTKGRSSGKQAAGAEQGLASSLKTGDDRTSATKRRSKKNPSREDVREGSEVEHDASSESEKFDSYHSLIEEDENEEEEEEDVEVRKSSSKQKRKRQDQLQQKKSGGRSRTAANPLIASGTVGVTPKLESRSGVLTKSVAVETEPLDANVMQDILAAQVQRKEAARESTRGSPSSKDEEVEQDSQKEDDAQSLQTASHGKTGGKDQKQSWERDLDDFLDVRSKTGFAPVAAVRDEVDSESIDTSRGAIKTATATSSSLDGPRSLMKQSHVVDGSLRVDEVHSKLQRTFSKSTMRGTSKRGTSNPPNAGGGARDSARLIADDGDGSPAVSTAQEGIDIEGAAIDATFVTEQRCHSAESARKSEFSLGELKMAEGDICVAAATMLELSAPEIHPPEVGASTKRNDNLRESVSNDNRVETVSATTEIVANKIEVVETSQQCDVIWTHLPSEIIGWLKVNLMMRDHATQYCEQWESTTIEHFPELSSFSLESMLRDFETFLSVTMCRLPPTKMEMRKNWRSLYRAAASKARSEPRGELSKRSRSLTDPGEDLKVNEHSSGRGRLRRAASLPGRCDDSTAATVDAFTESTVVRGHEISAAIGSVRRGRSGIQPMSMRLQANDDSSLRKKHLALRASVLEPPCKSGGVSARVEDILGIALPEEIKLLDKNRDMFCFAEASRLGLEVPEWVALEHVKRNQLQPHLRAWLRRAHAVFKNGPTAEVVLQQPTVQAPPLRDTAHSKEALEPEGDQRQATLARISIVLQQAIARPLRVGLDSFQVSPAPTASPVAVAWPSPPSARPSKQRSGRRATAAASKSAKPPPGAESRSVDYHRGDSRNAQQQCQYVGCVSWTYDVGTNGGGRGYPSMQQAMPEPEPEDALQNARGGHSCVAASGAVHDSGKFKVDLSQWTSPSAAESKPARRLLSASSTSSADRLNSTISVALPPLEQVDRKRVLPQIVASRKMTNANGWVPTPRDPASGRFGGMG